MSADGERCSLAGRSWHSVANEDGTRVTSSHASSQEATRRLTGEDVALTLPIPTPGLLTSPTKGQRASLVVSSSGPTSSIVESRFSLAALLTGGSCCSNTQAGAAPPSVAPLAAQAAAGQLTAAHGVSVEAAHSEDAATPDSAQVRRASAQPQAPPLPLAPATLEATATVQSWPLPREASTDVGSMPPSAEPSCGGTGETSAASAAAPFAEPLLEEVPVADDAEFCSAADSASPSAAEHAEDRAESGGDEEGGATAVPGGGAEVVQRPVASAPVPIDSGDTVAEVRGASSTAPALAAAPDTVAESGQLIIQSELVNGTDAEADLEEQGVAHLLCDDGSFGEVEHDVACNDDAAELTSMTPSALACNSPAAAVVLTTTASAAAAAAVSPTAAVNQEARPASAADLETDTPRDRWEQVAASPTAVSTCATPQLSPGAARTSAALAAALPPRTGPSGGLDLDEEERVVEAAAAVLNLSLPLRSSATKRKACPASPAGSARQQQPRLLSSPAASHAERGAPPVPAPHQAQLEQQEQPAAMQLEDDSDAAFLALEAAAAAAAAVASAPVAKPVPYSPLRDSKPALFLRQSHPQHAHPGLGLSLSHPHQHQAAQSPQPPGSAWRPLAPQEQEVMDTLQQLPAVIGSLSEEYQRYIRERALELTRIIDENLQRQGCGSAGGAAGDAAMRAAGEVGAGFGASPMSRWASGAGGLELAAVPSATPSKEATAAAALLLTVAVNKTRWPYGSLGSAGGCASCGGAVQVTPPQAVKTSGLDLDGGGGDDGTRRPFLSPGIDIVTPLVLRPLGHEQGAGPGGAGGGAGAGGSDSGCAGAARSPDHAHNAHAGPASSVAPAASYSMCMGSALAHSQVAEPDTRHSPELTSGAFSARGPGAAPAGTGGAFAVPGSGVGMKRIASGREHTPVSNPSAAPGAAGAAGDEAVSGSACGSTAVSKNKPQHGSAGQQPHQQQQQQQYSILQKLQPHLAKLQQKQKQHPPQPKVAPRGLGNGLGPGRGPAARAGGMYAAHAPRVTGAGKQAQQMPQFKGLGLDLGSLPYLDSGSTAALGPNLSARGNGNGTNRAGDLSARALQPPLSARSRAGPNTSKPGYATAAASAQRAEALAELEQKRRRILAAASAKAKQPAGAPKAAGGTGADGAPLSHRSRPAGYAAAAAAGLSAYQQLLRRVSSGGGCGGGAAHPAQQHNQQAEQAAGAGAAKCSAAEAVRGCGDGKAGAKAQPTHAEAAHVEALLHGLLRGSRAERLGNDAPPYSVVHAYPIMAAPQPERQVDAPEAPPPTGGGAAAPAAADAPLQTAFKLQDLLPGLTAFRASAAAPPVTRPQEPPQLPASLPEQEQVQPAQAAVQTGAPLEPVTAPTFSVAAVVGDGHHEPATGFVIVSRRATREVLPDVADAVGTGAVGSAGGSDGGAEPQRPAASQLDLRSLLPPPAWQRASRTTTPERLQPQPQQGPEQGAAAAAQQRQQQASGQVPTSMTARSVFAGAGGANAASLAASGRRWQLDADRCDADPLIVPDKEQIQHSSPVRPRYTSAADSHASPLTCNPQPQARPAAAGVRQQGPAGARGVAGQLPAKPGPHHQQQYPGAKANPVGRPARGQSAGPRPWGAGNGGAKRTGPAAATKAGAGGAGTGARSRSAPRAHLGAPQAAHGQQAPGTPCRAPSSPPPPMQSCTPAHLQQLPPQQRCSAAAAERSASPGPLAAAAFAACGAGGASRPASPVPQIRMEGLGAGLACGAANSPRTPTNRRLHVTSPEDMPLSAAAQHIQARMAAADAAAGRSTGGGSSSVLMVTAGSTVAPPPQAVPPPPAAVVASSLMGAASYRAAAPLPHKPRSTPAALTPQQLRGGACTAAAAGAVATGRPGFSGFHSSTTTVPGLAAAAAALAPPVWRPAASAAVAAAAVARAGGSPGAEECVSPGGNRRDSSPQPRGLGHDATPNILSPPRNYDRPWAAGMAGTGTPSRDAGAAAALARSSRAAAAAASQPQPPHAHEGTGPGAGGSRDGNVCSGTAGGGDRQPPAAGFRSCREQPDYARLGAMVSPSSSIQQSIKSAAAAQQPAAQQQLAAGPAKAAIGSGDTRGSCGNGRAVLSPRLSKDSSASLRASGGTSGAAAAAAAAVSAGAVQADGSARAPAPAAALASGAAGSYTSKMLARQSAAQQQQQQQRAPQPGRGGAVGAGLAAHSSGPGPDPAGDAEDAEDAPERDQPEDTGAGRVVDEAALEEEERRLTLEVGLLPPPMPTAAPAVPTANGARELRDRSSSSRSAIAASAPRAGVTASWRGGASGLGSLAASLAAGSAASDGRVRALLAQAAWPGLQQPMVEDALVTLATGIAVLDPLASASRVGAGTERQRAAGGGSHSPAAVPTGCFAGIFRRGHHGAGSAAAKAVAAAASAAPASAQPVLLRVQVGEDGAVQLVLMRSRRSAAPAGAAAGVGAGSPAEQRVRVAALTCMQPAHPVAPLAPSPLLLGASTSSAAFPSSTAAGAGAGALAASEDDADPASRWLQLVCMDGGLLRLSACSPADHARLVLGLNAAMAFAGGVVAADVPLAEVALRGLGPPAPLAAAP
ncbi:hypothetical protein HXX76_007553 [Chlamydomonas incerta]|uniref:Uncharacterized protein n=1 Tax=Chlamydomonas incerta TaxID=51695 RepID=A0A835TAV3_CHLIN|nr:hypothetical protein HXX76_007553 [Chlamydomonas incerta]|eukprot:KAG2434660.1 hypothetical protein HXX76_007553 [Chlamydomonas incerta]